MRRDGVYSTLMEVSADSDAFFNWERHDEFDNLPAAAARFLLEETTNVPWTIEQLVNDYTRRL